MGVSLKTLKVHLEPYDEEIDMFGPVKQKRGTKEARRGNPRGKKTKNQNKTKRGNQQHLTPGKQPERSRNGQICTIPTPGEEEEKKKKRFRLPLIRLRRRKSEDRSANEPETGGREVIGKLGG